MKASTKFILVGPAFRGGITIVNPEQGWVMELEVQFHLAKEALECIPPPKRESGFYSRYFIVPRKDGACIPS